MAALGIAPGAFERPAEAAEDQAYAVWPEGRDALRLFLACQTQWRMLAVGGLWGGRMIWQGIDYRAAAVAAEGLGLRLAGELFADLRAMEAAAAAELNRR